MAFKGASAWAAKFRAPVMSHAWGAHVFFRLLGLVYLAAFASLLPQVEGLSGDEGILPAAWILQWARDGYGAAAFLQFPSLFWIDAHSATLLAAAWTGCVLALFAVAGVCPPLIFGLLWFLYLSFVNAGGLFFSFQWDALLLEAGLLATLLAPRCKFQAWNRPDPLPLWGLVLLGCLLFRLMFFSGWVKLASGDSAWSSLTALDCHFETQPLPTPLAWSAHHLPPNLLALAVIGMFVIELGLPFLLLGPRLLRRIACAGFLALQAGIALTGNYGFFNLLGAVLVLPFLDNVLLSRLVPARWKNASPPPATGTLPGLPALACGAVLLLFSLCMVLQQTGLAPGARAVLAPLAHWRLVSGYGLFAVMTRDRPELIIEGSQDGRHWEPYRFKDKPTDAGSHPSWVAPHMPRLDWQLWFAALGNPEGNPWVRRLLQQLRHESPAVLALLASNPFPDEPPRWLRVRRALFSFSTPGHRKATGEVWNVGADELYMLETPLPQAP